MRINEGDYAYEVRKNRNLLTQVATSWQYLIYLVKPIDILVEKATFTSLEAAERAAKRRIAQLTREDSEVPIAA